MKIKDTVQNYSDYITGSRSHGTSNAYIKALSRFIQSVGDKDLNELKLNDFIRYKADMVKRRLSSSTMASEISALLSFVRYVRNVLKIKHIDVDDIKMLRPQVTQTVPEAFELFEVQEFIESAEDIEDRTLIELLFNTGARVREILCLTKGDIFKKDVMIEGSIVPVTWIRILGKGSRERNVPLNERADEVLNRYLQYLELRYPKRDRIFTRAYKTVWRRFKEIGKKSNSDLRPHKLRHTSATELCAKGVGLNEIAKLLGHSNINSTKRYAQVKDQGLVKTVRHLA